MEDERVVRGKRACARAGGAALALVLAVLSPAAAGADTSLPPRGAAPVADRDGPRTAAGAYALPAPFTWRYDEEIAGVVTELIERSPGLTRPIYAELGIAPVKGVIVHVARDHDEFLKSAPPGDRFPEWAEGITIPPRGEIFLTLFDANHRATDLERVFAHEVSHVAVYVAADFANVPRWFVEGYAILQSGEFSMDQVETMARLVARGGVSLRLMDRSFHEHAPSASAAYGAAADFVRYYRDVCGRPALADTVAAVREGADFYSAMGARCRAEGGGRATFEAIEAAWQSGLRDKYPWWTVLRDDLLLWVAGGCLLGLGFFVVRRRRRLQASRLEDHETRLDTASDRAVAAEEETDRRRANAALLRRRRRAAPAPALEHAHAHPREQAHEPAVAAAPAAAPAPTPSKPTSSDDEDSAPPGGWVH